MLAEKDIQINFYIFKKEEPNKIIRDIKILNIIRGFLLSCFLGYKIDKDENGKGWQLK